MTLSTSHLDKDGEGRMLLNEMPSLYRRHLTLSLLRQLDHGRSAQERCLTPLRVRALEGPIGRKVENYVAKYDRLGCGFVARCAVIECLVSISLKKKLIAEEKNLFPTTYKLTDEGKKKLEARDQHTCALVAQIIRDKKKLNKLLEDIRDIS